MEASNASESESAPMVPMRAGSIYAKAEVEAGTCSRLLAAVGRLQLTRREIYLNLGVLAAVLLVGTDTETHCEEPSMQFARQFMVREKTSSLALVLYSCLLLFLVVCYNTPGRGPDLFETFQIYFKCRRLLVWSLYMPR